MLTITLPALYISVVSYNPELFRVQLAFSIAGSRSASLSIVHRSIYYALYDRDAY